MLQEKQFFLSCLKNGPVSHRRIANKISSLYSTSPATIKNALLQEGLIELAFTKREGQSQKIIYYYKLTDKKFEEPEPKKVVVVKKEWEDGTPKSQGNAFDWSSTKCSLFSKAELASMTQKYNNNNPITIYSRA